MELIKVAGERHLLKNPDTGVVINNDEAGYRAYLAQAELNAAKRQKMLTVEQEIDSMKEDIAEIKNILKLLVEKL
jgi:hypothetical protein